MASSDRTPFARAGCSVKIDVISGDILRQNADVLVCPANVQLNMSGGINGELLRRGGDTIQQQLHDHLRTQPRPWAEPGTVIRTDAGTLPFLHVLHAVAINALYESSVELVRDTIAAALRRAADLSACSVALAALATGYGPLNMEQFAQAVVAALRDDFAPVDRVTIVVRHADEAAVITSVLSNAAGDGNRD